MPFKLKPESIGKIFLLIGILGALSYVSKELKNKEDDVIKQFNSNSVNQYLLEHDDIIKSKKPILWIHIPREVNARNWKSFGSRNSNDLNQPYLYLCLKSIIDKCGNDFNICLIEDCAINFSSKYDSEKNNEMRKLISERKSETEVIELLPYSMDIERNLLQQLSKDDDPKNAIRSIPLQLRRFYIQAYQSFLFNKTLSLANEFEENLFEPEIDDVCFDKNSILGKFENDPKQKLAIPLVGHSYYKKSRFDYYIKKILDEELLTPKDFFIKDFQELSVEGGFRNASINYLNFKIDENMIKFQLSRGSYATILLREILKPSNPLDSGF